MYQPQSWRDRVVAMLCLLSLSALYGARADPCTGTPCKTFDCYLLDGVCISYASDACDLRHNADACRATPSCTWDGSACVLHLRASVPLAWTLFGIFAGLVLMVLVVARCRWTEEHTQTLREQQRQRRQQQQQGEGR